MYRATRQEFCIKVCPTNELSTLENTLNSMSKEGWELYSLHEVEMNGNMKYNCIFVREVAVDDEDTFEDISGFKTQMEKMLYSKEQPYELCLNFQKKIREKREKIENIKKFLENAKENERGVLNEEISKEIDRLNALKKQLKSLLSPSKMASNLGEERLSINLSEEIYALNDPDREYNLLAQTVKARQELTQELGYIIPKVLFVENSELQPNEFSINVHAIPVVKARVYSDHLMYFADEINLQKTPKGSVKETDLLTGRKIVWIPKKETENYWVKGIEPSEYIAGYLKHYAVLYVLEIFNYADINRYIEIVSENNSFLVDSILGEFISVSELKYIFCQLIRERVSVKDIIYIFEKINDYSDDSTKTDLLDKLRVSLSRQICQSLADEHKQIFAYEVSESVISAIEKQTEKADEEDALVRIDSSKFKKFTEQLEKITKEQSLILVVPQYFRQILFAIISQLNIDIPVICYEEVAPEYELKIAGKI